MKKLLLLIFSFSMATVTFSSCGFLGGLFDDPQESSSPTSSIEAPSSEQEEKVYTVTFVQNGEIVKTLEIKEGAAVTEADIPTLTAKVGYTVVWESVDLSNITENIEVNAIETANTYTITFDTDGGDAIDAQSVVYDSDVSLPEPTREGFTFVAWLDAEGNVVSSGKWTTADNITLKASWTAIQVQTYTVTFQREDGYVLATETVVEGGTLTEIPGFPSDAGYTYAWDINNFENITSDMIVTLIATANSYTITYDVNGGTIISGETTQTVVYNEVYTALAPTVEKAGYTFGGWDGLSALPNGIWTLTEDATLTAQWNEIIPDTFTISFVIDGQVSETRTVAEGGTLTDIPALPTGEGYTYAWDVDLTDIIITSDMTVTLIKTANTYTITYNPGEGTITSGDANETVTYGQSYTLHQPTATREGYNFVCWEISEGTLPVGNWNIASDVVMNAVWEAKQVYSVKFVQSGQPVKEFSVEQGSKFTEIPDPATKTGYTVKWSDVDLAKLNDVQSDVTVNAVETANTYVITYVDDNGIFAGTVLVTYDSAYNWTLESEPVVGYHFDKFTLEDGTYVAASGTWTIVGDVSVVVHWAGNTYTVVLNANGGTCAQTQITVTYGQAYDLPAATRDGHTFEGWTLGGAPVEQSGIWQHTAAGTIELVASWSSEEWTKNY